MNKNIDYFKALISMPEFNVKKGDVILRGSDGKYSVSVTGTVFPPYVNLRVGKEIVSIHQLYDNETIVVPNFNVIPLGFPSGMYVVKDFYMKQEKYVLVAYDERNLNNPTHVIKVSDNKFKVAKVYYFINSSGKVQMTYFGKDTEADSWRSATNNVFQTKDYATIKKNEILYSFTTSDKL